MSVSTIHKCDMTECTNSASSFITLSETYYYCSDCRATYPEYTQKSFIECDDDEWDVMAIETFEY